MSDVAEEAPQSWVDFLIKHPPGHTEPITVTDCVQHRFANGYSDWRIALPDLQFHCETCNGIRFFEADENNETISTKHFSSTFLHYSCKNCEKQRKQYAVALTMYPKKTGQTVLGEAIKLGEFKPFRPYVPKNVLKLFDDKEELFKNGLSAEGQSLGIGAFAYYRQIVEAHKNNIIDKIIEAIKKDGGSQQTIEMFEGAKKEHQFLKSIEMIEGVLPVSLIIDGHNPLKALHAALSQGLHAKTDKECLELAQIIREVLVGLSERIADVLKKHSAFAKAVGTLARISGKTSEKVENPKIAE